MIERLYREGLKNWELSQEALANFYSGAGSMVREQSISGDKKFAAKPMLSKTNFSITSSIPCPLRNWIPSALDIVESVTGPSNLDIMETTVDPKAVCLRLAMPIAMISYISPYPFATLALSFLSLSFATRFDSMQAKRILSEKKIAQIISESHGNSKKALIIQSPKDEYGALSMRSHIEKVRDLAKTHAIEKVVISNEEEYLKTLPAGRFDIVWIRSHGTPTSIEMSSTFKITKSCRPEIFHTLASKIKQHGKLILECCHVANADFGKGNIAEHIASYCWDATVYAPLTKISGIFGFEFDKWGYPQFNDGFNFKGRSVTRIIEGPVPRYRRIWKK